MRTAKKLNEKPVSDNPDLTFIITSDWHLDAITSGVERFDELKRAVDSVVAKAILNKVDFFIFLGDLTDPHTSRAYRADKLATETATRLAQAEVNSIWLVGNHDVIEDGRGTHTLMGLAGCAAANGSIYVVDRPVIFRNGFNSIDFLCLPYPSATTSFDVLEEGVAMLKSSNARTVVVFSHLNLNIGVREGSESKDMRKGRDVYLPIQELQAVASSMGKRIYFFNGHYHKHQIDKTSVSIPGSLARLRFDEENNTPGWLEVELRRAQGDDEIQIDFCEVKDSATMVTWDLSHEPTPPLKSDFLRLRGRRQDTDEVLKSYTTSPVKVDVVPDIVEFFEQPVGVDSPRAIVEKLVAGAPNEIRDLVKSRAEKIMGEAGL